ncbi:MAG: hypothetical protein ABI426_07425 [Flavobacterium sp.]
MSSNKKVSDYNKPNFWGMIQNVLIAALNKGQFLLGFVGLILMIMVLKLTQEDTKSLLDDIIGMFKDWHYFGWALGIFSTSGWYLGTKRLRHINTKEINRISAEKKQLQLKATNKKLRSSNN